MTELRQIMSRDNDRLKEARRVRDGKENGKIFIEGVRLVGEAVRCGLAIDSIFVAQEALARVVDKIDGSNVREVYELGTSAFDSISDTVTSQGIVALADRPISTYHDLEKSLSSATIPVVIFLHEINNPSNLGAVVRTAEASGVAGVMVSRGSADAYAPKALRAAMGSSFRLPILAGVTFDEAVEFATANEMRTTAADINASVGYTKVDWTIKRMVVFGSEAHGLSEGQRGRVKDLLLIPMEKTVESLNLAVACGIVLFEARRQILPTD